jgi:hypothetical protein
MRQQFRLSRGQGWKVFGQCPGNLLMVLPPGGGE